MIAQFQQISKWFNNRRFLVVALVFSLSLLALAVYLFSVRNNILEADYMQQNLKVIQQNKFDNIFLNVVKASSAIRGYSATGNKRFIKNFQANIDSVRTGFYQLKSMQEASATKIDPLVFEKFSNKIWEKVTFNVTINKLCEMNMFDSALKMLATERGIILSDEIIVLTEEIISSLSEQQELNQIRFSELNRRNNNLAYFSLFASMVIIALVFYFLFKEISRVKNISAQLMTQKEFMQVTLKSLGEGLITTDREGAIVYMNPAAEKITGWRNREATNRALQSIYRIVNEETGQPFDNIVKRIITEGKPVELENNTILATRDNRKVVISNNGAPLKDSFGNILGAVLVFNDITEKKKTQDLLKQNEQRFRNMLENIPEAVYTCDENGVIQMYNKAAVTLWGQEPKIGIDRWAGAWKMLHTDGTEMPFELSPMAQAIKEKKAILGKELLIKRPDGSLRHVLPSPTPLFDTNGRLTGAVNMLFDITDKIQREQLIRKTEEKYKNLFEQASDAILTWSFDGTIHEFNDIICDLSGYTKEEFSKLNLSEIVEGDFVMSTQKYEDILAGKSTTLNRKFRKKDGSIVDMEVKIKLLPDGKVLGMGRDITDRLRYEEKLKEANERYEILAMATSDTIWDWDIKNDSMTYNSGIKTMFGYETLTVGLVSNWRKDKIHPDDISMANETLTQAFENKSQTLQLEYRYRCADNSFKHILDRAYIVYDENGQPERMIGAMQDITSEIMHERNMAIAIVETQEKERKELGMELHDNVNQLLSATMLYLSMAKKSSSLGTDVSDVLADCIVYLGDAINEIRNLSHRLTPYTKDEIDFKSVVELLVDPIRKTNEFGIRVQIENLEDKAIDAEVKTCLYRIIQTQLTNILKHAAADNVQIMIRQLATGIQLIIKDDGRGFDPSQSQGGIGLHNIRHRAEMFGGSFSVDAAPGKGCEIKVEIPV